MLCSVDLHYAHYPPLKYLFYNCKNVYSLSRILIPGKITEQLIWLAGGTDYSSMKQFEVQLV